MGFDNSNNFWATKMSGPKQKCVQQSFDFGYKKSSKLVEIFLAPAVLAQPGALEVGSVST